ASVINGLRSQKTLPCLRKGILRVSSRLHPLTECVNKWKHGNMWPFESNEPGTAEDRFGVARPESAKGLPPKTTCNPDILAATDHETSSWLNTPLQEMQTEGTSLLRAGP